jgi:hypothetical protein
MYLQYRGHDCFEKTGDGFLQFLETFNLKEEFYNEYEEGINLIQKHIDNKEIVNNEEKILDIFISRYNFQSLLESLFYKNPNKVRKGLGYGMVDHNNEEDGIEIEWFEAIYTNEEALDIVVDLIRKNNISQADVFENILQTS